MNLFSAWQLALVGFLAWASASDLRSRIIPNGSSLGGTVAVAALLAAAGGAVASHLAWGAGLVALLALAGAMRPGSLGGGDVKLAGLLGVALGPGASFALAIGFGAALAWALAGTVGRGGVSLRGRTVPLGPWLALGAAVACGLVG